MRKYKINPITGKHDLISEESLVVQSAPQEAVRYGLLYNHPTVTDPRGLAADGWHVLSKAEAEALQTYCGGETIGGLHLKDTDPAFWDEPIFGDNEYGFSARGAGVRGVVIPGTPAQFSALKQFTQIWTTDTHGDGLNAWAFMLHNDDATFNFVMLLMVSGLSVRLAKDATALSNGETGTYTGNDGRIYPTICINGTEYLAIHLAETKFANGESIEEVTDAADWSALATAALCAHSNDWTNAIMTISAERSVNLAAGEKLILGESLSGTGTEADPLGVNPDLLPDQLWEEAGTDAIKPVDIEKKVLIASDGAEKAASSKLQVNSTIHLRPAVNFDNNLTTIGGGTLGVRDYNIGFGNIHQLSYQASNGNEYNLSAQFIGKSIVNPMGSAQSSDTRVHRNIIITGTTENFNLTLNRLTSHARGVVIIQHAETPVAVTIYGNIDGAGNDYIALTTNGDGTIPLSPIGVGYYSIIEYYFTGNNVLVAQQTVVSSTGSPVPDPARQSNTDLDTGTEVIATVPVATYDAVFFDYKVKKGANLRAGTIMAVTDGATVNYTEMGTTDLGDTSGVSLTVDLDSGNIRLLGTATTDDWEIQTLIRGL